MLSTNGKTAQRRAEAYVAETTIYKEGYMQKQTSRLIPLTDWPKHHEWPPLGGLRHLVFHSKSTGFDSVIKRVNRRVLIDEMAFFEWVATKNAKGGDRE